MADTSIILNRIRSHGLFSRSDLRIVMEECGYQTSDGITNHMITRPLTSAFELYIMQLVKSAVNLKYCRNVGKDGRHGRYINYFE